MPKARSKRASKRARKQHPFSKVIEHSFPQAVDATTTSKLRELLESLSEPSTVQQGSLSITVGSGRLLRMLKNSGEQEGKSKVIVAVVVSQRVRREIISTIRDILNVKGIPLAVLPVAPTDFGKMLRVPSAMMFGLLQEHESEVVDLQRSQGDELQQVLKLLSE